MRKFKLLRDTPDNKAGAIYQENEDIIGSYYHDVNVPMLIYRASHVEDNPLWFQEVFPKFKVGDFVRSDKADVTIKLEKETKNGFIASGITNGIMFVSKEGKFDINNMSDDRLATSKEIYDMLCEMARQKGFVQGSYFGWMNTGVSKTILPFKLSDITHSLINGDEVAPIYDNQTNKWAEVVEAKPKGVMLTDNQFTLIEQALTEVLALLKEVK